LQRGGSGAPRCSPRARPTLGQGHPIPVSGVRVGVRRAPLGNGKPLRLQGGRGLILLVSSPKNRRWSGRGGKSASLVFFFPSGAAGRSSRWLRRRAEPLEARPGGKETPGRVFNWCSGVQSRGEATIRASDGRSLSPGSVRAEPQRSLGRGCRRRWAVVAGTAVAAVPLAGVSRQRVFRPK